MKNKGLVIFTLAFWLVVLLLNVMYLVHEYSVFCDKASNGYHAQEGIDMARLRLPWVRDKALELGWETPTRKGLVPVQYVEILEQYSGSRSAFDGLVKYVESPQAREAKGLAIAALERFPRRWAEPKLKEWESGQGVSLPHEDKNTLAEVLKRMGRGN
jgi:hypothetical protein